MRSSLNVLKASWFVIVNGDSNFSIVLPFPLGIFVSGRVMYPSSCPAYCTCSFGIWLIVAARMGDACISRFICKWNPFVCVLRICSVSGLIVVCSNCACIICGSMRKYDSIAMRVSRRREVGVRMYGLRYHFVCAFCFGLWSGDACCGGDAGAGGGGGGGGGRCGRWYW